MVLPHLHFILNDNFIAPPAGSSSHPVYYNYSSSSSASAGIFSLAFRSVDSPS